MIELEIQIFSFTGIYKLLFFKSKSYTDPEFESFGIKTFVVISFFVIDRDGVDPMPSITPAGFQFLLMDIGSQVWYFMLQYLDTVEVRVISLVTHNFLLTALGTSVHDEFFFILQARGMDLIDCLSFLFQLSFSTLGKVCH